MRLKQSRPSRRPDCELRHQAVQLAAMLPLNAEEASRILHFAQEIVAYYATGTGGSNRLEKVIKLAAVD